VTLQASTGYKCSAVCHWPIKTTLNGTEVRTGFATKTGTMNWYSGGLNHGWSCDVAPGGAFGSQVNWSYGDFQWGDYNSTGSLLAGEMYAGNYSRDLILQSATCSESGSAFQAIYKDAPTSTTLTLIE
jgi:hypothetical protein